MAVSLRSNTHLGTQLLLQSRLAQVGAPALLQNRILEWIGLLPRSERVMRAKPENFRGLRPRIVITTQLNVGNGLEHVASGIVEFGRERFLVYGARFLKAPHRQISESYLH